MTRTPLNLNGKTMTELMEMDREIGTSLDGIRYPIPVSPMSNSYRQWMEEKQATADSKRKSLLADRRQIRARMEELKTIESVGRRIGQAIACDVIADNMPRQWTGLDPQDAEQIPAGMDQDAVEAVAKQEYLIRINA